MRSAVQSLNRVQWSCQRWFVIFLSSVQWSVLRPTYVRCPTKHTNFMYRQGCIWMKVCQRWCKLDRGPLQAYCAWKRPLASWNMQLPWLDSVSCWLSESAQTLSHHVLMKTNDLRGLPYSEASPQLSLRGTPDTAVWTPDQGSRKFCWGIRGLCSAVNCVVQQRHSIFWGLMIAIFSTVCIISDRPRSGVEDETG